MKIALCISGFTRQYKECFRSYSQFLLSSLQPTVNEVHVFLHGWHDKPEEVEMITGLYNAKSYHFHPFSLDKMQEIMNDVNVGYITSLDQSVKENRMKNNITGMFYNIYKCNELKKQYAKEHDIKYDVTIHTRFDNAFFRPISLSVKPNTITFEHCRSNICDHFYYGSDESMNTVAEIYLKLQELFAKKWSGIGAEHLLHYYIQREKRMDVFKRGGGIQHSVYYMATQHHKKLLIE